MYLSDYHTHCSLSFDSKTPVEDMVRAGIAQGLQEMCLTDHVDLFRPRETARWEHDFSNREETFARADQAADGKIIVRRGIELGEAMRDFAYADELLLRLPELDFVIGSQHQLSEKYDWNDLYFMPEATEQEAREQIADYLTLVLETAKWGKFSVLGHLTLPLRYMNENHGMHMSFDGFEDEVAQVFRALIENGCGIECNVNRGNTPLPDADILKLYRSLGGEIINISATSKSHINAMDMNKEYDDGANPVILKSEFIMSLCEQLIGGENLGAKQKSIIDRCTASVYRVYQQSGYTGTVPTLRDFREELLRQDEPEAREIALAIELFTNGSLNTFAKPTNVDTHNRLICYDILDLGKQLMPIGMLVVLDSILNRITQNRAKGKQTFIFIDEIYLLFQHEYSANFLFTLWKRVRKYGAYATGITQNVDDLLQSHTARTMLANSEFLIMLNQASTDRLELAKLLNISDRQLSYITNVDAGHGLIKVGSSLVPFANKFPKNTKLYKLMTTKPGEGA